VGESVEGFQRSASGNSGKRKQGDKEQSPLKKSRRGDQNQQSDLHYLPVDLRKRQLGQTTGLCRLLQGGGRNVSRTKLGMKAPTPPLSLTFRSPLKVVKCGNHRAGGGKAFVKAHTITARRGDSCEKWRFEALREKEGDCRRLRMRYTGKKREGAESATSEADGEECERKFRAWR